MVFRTIVVGAAAVMLWELNVQEDDKKMIRQIAAVGWKGLESKCREIHRKMKDDEKR